MKLGGIRYLYNRMIHPIIPYAIRGALWYRMACAYD